MFTCRGDKNAWLGETKDRKIGFFKSEHVEDVSEENVDGKSKHVNRIPFNLIRRWLKLHCLVFK